MNAKNPECTYCKNNNKRLLYTVNYYAFLYIEIICIITRLYHIGKISRILTKLLCNIKNPRATYERKCVNGNDTSIYRYYIFR